MVAGLLPGWVSAVVIVALVAAALVFRLWLVHLERVDRRVFARARTKDGLLVGIADEYGTVWDGEPGTSRRIGDLIQRPDEETMELYLDDSVRLVALDVPRRERVEELLNDALVTDGGHHKQWALEEIARTLGLRMVEHEEGIPG